MGESYRWCACCRQAYRYSEAVPQSSSKFSCPHCGADVASGLVWNNVRSLYGWPDTPEVGAVYEPESA